MTYDCKIGLVNVDFGFVVVAGTNVDLVTTTRSVLLFSPRDCRNGSVPRQPNPFINAIRLNVKVLPSNHRGSDTLHRPIFRVWKTRHNYTA